MSHRGQIMPSSESLSFRSCEDARHHTQNYPDTWGHDLAQFLGHRTWRRWQFTGHSMENHGDDYCAFTTQSHEQPSVNDDFVTVLSKGKGWMSWHPVTSPFPGPWDCLYWVEVVGTEICISFGVICFVYLSRFMKQIVRTDFLIFLFMF